MDLDLLSRLWLERITEEDGVTKQEFYSSCYKCCK